MDCSGPFVFRPLLQIKVWGGDQLRELFPTAAVGDGPVGEAWLFGDLDAGTTVVLDGPAAGLTARDLAQRYGEWLLGPDLDDYTREGYPLLLKLIDARQRLSVQVHPDDDAARRLTGAPRGKDEAWYIVSADPGSRLYLGTSSAEAPATQIPRVAAGDDSLLGRVAARPGCCYPIPAGTIHAIGEGILLAEIQQSSDTTYRIYDWGRTGLDGRPRPLHVPEAIACALTGPCLDSQEPPPAWSDDGGVVEVLTRRPSFVFERITLTGRLELALPEVGFSLLLPLDDGVSLLHDSVRTALPPFHAVLVPASWPTVQLVAESPRAVVLRAAPLRERTGPCTAPALP